MVRMESTTLKLHEVEIIVIVDQNAVESRSRGLYTPPASSHHGNGLQKEVVGSCCSREALFPTVIHVTGVKSANR